MPEMKFDWAGLLSLLAENLYSEKRIFIRELVQNAHDAIKRNGTDFRGGEIRIRVDPKRSLISFSDNGDGMDRAGLEDYLSTIGTGATRLARNEGLIGYFGIGFLSAFIVADRVEVTTKRRGEQDCWRWVNAGDREYTISKLPSCDHSGTRVDVYVRPEDIGVTHRAEIEGVVRHYCDMISIPIFYNDEKAPLNRSLMPWEDEKISKVERDIQCKIYVSESLHDDALEIIPVHHPKANGILYITRNRVVGVNAPQTVKVFLNRMLVSANEPDMLPAWASFVSGIINVDGRFLRPTAARDNVVRDSNFKELREHLGDLVVSYLDDLRSENPEKFSKIQEFHWLGIRGGCLHYEPFFQKFVNLLEWKTNDLDLDQATGASKEKLRTLPEVVRLSQRDSQETGVIYLRCFGSAAAQRHCFAMAAAAKAIVIDASDFFGLSLLERYVKEPENGNLRLLRIDKDDDPTFFRPLPEDDDTRVAELANAMSNLTIRGPDGRHHTATVVARIFEPSNLPAIIRPGKDHEKFERARMILEDPASSKMHRDLAEDVLKNAAYDLTLAINGGHPLIQRLAKYPYNDPDVTRLMLGLYNSAFLTSDSMSNYNAEILHRDFMHFVSTSLDFLEFKAKVADNWPKQDGPALRKESSHLTFMMVVPFKEKYAPVISAVRSLVEDDWSAELLIASDRKFEDRILDSINRHIALADGFFVELSEANPNVMFEFGCIIAARRGRPIVQLASTSFQNAGSSQVFLPADLQGMIYVDYGDLTGDKLIKSLNSGARADVALNELLSSPARGMYISKTKMRALARILPLEICERLCRDFPTSTSWKTTSLKDFTGRLPEEYRSFAEQLLLEIRAGLRIDVSKQPSIDGSP
jgi:HSP90 family molecular chaperone